VAVRELGITEELHKETLTLSPFFILNFGIKLMLDVSTTHERKSLEFEGYSSVNTLQSSPEV
jgi:hypothetical protein